MCKKKGESAAVSQDNNGKVERASKLEIKLISGSTMYYLVCDQAPLVLFPLSSFIMERVQDIT